MQNLSVARRADGEILGRSVEAEDDQIEGYCGTLRMNTPTRLPATNQVILCTPGMLEVILFT